MGPLIRLDWALLQSSRLARLALMAFSLAAVLAVAAGLQWQQRYKAVAEPEREQVRDAAKELSTIFDGISDGTVTPFDLRRPEDEWPPYAEYVIDPRDPYAASYYHYQLADLPPGPVMALAHGVTPLHPNHVLIHSIGINKLFRPAAPPERTNPTVLAMGRFDLLALILLLVPLTAIAILHDSKSREAENGISPILSSFGTRANALLNARLVFRGGILVALIATIVLAAGTIGKVPAGRLAAFAAGACIYTVFWVVITGVIAARSRSAIGSAAASLSLFAAIVLVLPGVAENLARPEGLLKPRALVDAEIRALGRKWEAEGQDDERIRYVAEEFWGLSGGVLPECADYKVAFANWSSARLAGYAFGEAHASAHEASRSFDRRLDVLGVLVPPLGFRRAMEEIAGSSAARARVFEQSVIEFHTQWLDRGTEALLNCARWNREDFEAAPAYSWEEPAPASTTLGYAIAGFGIWGGLGLLLLFRPKREKD